MLKRSRWFLALAAVLAAMPVAAHHVDVPEPAKLAPGPLAIATAVQGHVNAIVVENRVTGTTRNFTVLVAGDGHRYMLSGPSAGGVGVAAVPNLAGPRLAVVELWAIGDGARRPCGQLLSRGRGLPPRAPSRPDTRQSAPSIWDGGGAH